MKFTGLLFAVAALAASPALGQINFTNAGGDLLWHNSSNWSTTTPTAGDDAIVSVLGSGPVSATISILNSDPDAFTNNLTLRRNSIDVGNGRTLNVTGNLVVDQSGPYGFQGLGSLAVSGSASLLNGPMSVASATFGGNLMFGSNGGSTVTSGSLVTNGGVTFDPNGTFLFNGTNWSNGATSTVARSASIAGTSLQLNSGTTVSNSGTFSFTGGNATALNLNSGSSFTNEAGGFFNLAGHSMTVAGGTFTNAGTVSVDGGNTLTFANYADNGGTVELTNGGVVDFGGDLTVTAGKVGGTGQVNENLTLVGGTIEPGNSPGTLTINGNLTLDGGATLVLELVDTGSFDILNVTGDVNLTNAAITVDASGLTANVGDSFAFLTSGGTTSGMFTNPMTFTSGIYEFELSHSAGGASLLVTAVPEPSSLALLGVAGVGAIMRRRRR